MNFKGLIILISGVLLLAACQPEERMIREKDHKAQVEAKSQAKHNYERLADSVNSIRTVSNGTGSSLMNDLRGLCSMIVQAGNVIRDIKDGTWIDPSEARCWVLDQALSEIYAYDTLKYEHKVLQEKYDRL